MPASVIAGLGNPGASYHGTRHNVGFRMVDALAEAHLCRWKEDRGLECQVARMHIAGQPVILAKPMTFMNHSGRAQAAISRYFHLNARSFCVIYDEIQMEPGRMKITLGGSAGGHNGAADIIQCLGPDFARLRVGIGNKPDLVSNLADWVLSRFSADDEAKVADALPEILNALHYLVEFGPEKAMNSINTRTSKPSNESDKQQT